MTSHNFNNFFRPLPIILFFVVFSTVYRIIYPILLETVMSFKDNLFSQCFQPFSSRGTSQKFLIICRNLNPPFSTIYGILREPSKELAEPLGPRNPGWKTLPYLIFFHLLRTSSTNSTLLRRTCSCLVKCKS